MPRSEQQIEMARRAAAAADRRAQERAERGMPRVRREREQAELEARQRFDMRLLELDAGAIYDLLPPREKWREHIDGRHQHHGREVYLRSLHNPLRRPDPKYNMAMLMADRHVRSTFGRDFTVEDYARTHELAAPVDVGDMGLRPRVGPLDVEFAAFNDTIEDLEAENHPYVKGRAGTTVTLAAVENPLREVHELLTAYHGLRLSFEPLRDIARLHQALENLHPYVDFNTRTNRLVLNRLLAQKKEPLCILHSPLDVHHSTLDHWVAAIEAGQREWIAVVEEHRGRGPTWQALEVDRALLGRMNLPYTEESFSQLLGRFA